MNLLYIPKNIPWNSGLTLDATSALWYAYAYVWHMVAIPTIDNIDTMPGAKRNNVVNPKT